MGAGVAIPNHFNLDHKGYVLTLVLPAQQCNLKCSWCYIDARGEVNKEQRFLNKYDYLTFIQEFAKKTTIDLIAIQGYEPLLDETWQYTDSVIALANSLDIPVSLVTNGIELAKRASALSGRLDCLIVSLDADNAKNHDKTRGVSGAFDQTVKGLRVAVSDINLSKILSVSSVLQPNIDALLNMPRLLRDLGVKRWSLNPLHKVGENNFGCFVAPQRLKQHIQHLKNLAENESIELSVDDELSNNAVLDALAEKVFIRRLGNAERVLRLSPNGHISQGSEILSQRYSYVLSSTAVTDILSGKKSEQAQELRFVTV